MNTKNQDGSPTFREKTTAQKMADAAKPDALCTELLRVQAIKDKERKLLEDLHAEERKKREQYETAQAVEAQRVAQAKLDEEQAPQERQHNLMAFDRLNKTRRESGLGPVSWERFAGQAE